MSVSGEYRATLTGIVTAATWDESGAATGVLLSATDEQDYRIENGDRFLGLLRTSIRASGVVRIRPGGERTLQIDEFFRIGG